MAGNFILQYGCIYTLQEHDLLADIDALRKSRLELEQRLHEVSEDKRRLEAELARQREALRKVQDREQDLSKDIETLRDENSHHSGTISKLQVCVEEGRQARVSAVQKQCALYIYMRKK